MAARAARQAAKSEPPTVLADPVKGVIGVLVAVGLETLRWRVSVNTQCADRRDSYNPVEAAVPTGYVDGRPDLIDDGIGTIALVDASGTTTVERELTGTTGTGVPVGATVTVK